MRGLWRRIEEVVRRRQVDRDSADELAHHVELLVASYVDEGMSEADARRQARLDAGSMASASEQIAEGRTGFALEQAVREVRYAARLLRRSPGVTLVSVVTMGAGIGISTLLFAMVNGILLQPLPYPDADRLVRIFDTHVESGVTRAGAASGNINDWRRRAAAFDGIAGYFAMGRTIVTGGDAAVVTTAQVSEDFFPILQTAPLLGRTFTAEETRRATFSNAAAPTGTDLVVILSHRLWRQRFGGDPGVIGRSIVLERRPFEIVGVMPERFAMPDAGVQLWTPWDVSTDRPRDQHYLGAVARLKPGISMAQAEDQLNAVARQLGTEYPESNHGWGVQLASLHAETIGDTARVLWVLLLAVGLVLLAACANVALLSLMRGLDRAEESAVRRALGASSGRLLREFLMESVLLSAVGGAIGAAIAAAGLRLLPRLSADLPRLEEVGIDARALLFIAAVTSLSAIVSGLPQAWRRARLTSAASLAGGSPRLTAGRQVHLLRDAIVVAQVGTAVVLMAGSGLLVRSYLHLRNANPGFDPRGVLVAPIFLDSEAYGSAGRARTYYRTLFDRLAAVPGVATVGGATTVPTGRLGPDFERPVWPDGAAAGARRVPASVRMITPGYFETLGVRLVQGRPIDESDQPQSPRVVVISQTLASRLWPGARAVGQKLVIDYSVTGTYAHDVVGVAGDVRFRGPRSEPAPEIYLPHAQRPYLVMNVVLKTGGDPRALVPAVRAAIKEVDAQKPAHGIYPLEDLLGHTYVRDRQAMLTLLLFAGTASFLAMLSVYGVLSQRVRERSREIGIRMAMGAGASSLVRGVAMKGLRLVALGIVAGIFTARVLAGTLDGMLYGVPPTDPITALLTAACLGAVGMVATLIPSWRATRIDPVTILRRG